MDKLTADIEKLLRGAVITNLEGMGLAASNSVSEETVIEQSARDVFSPDIAPLSLGEFEYRVDCLERGKTPTLEGLEGWGKWKKKLKKVGKKVVKKTKRFVPKKLRKTASRIAKVVKKVAPYAAAATAAVFAAPLVMPAISAAGASIGAVGAKGLAAGKALGSKLLGSKAISKAKSYIKGGAKGKVQSAVDMAKTLLGKKGVNVESKAGEQIVRAEVIKSQNLIESHRQALTRNTPYPQSPAPYQQYQQSPAPYQASPMYYAGQSPYGQPAPKKEPVDFMKFLPLVSIPLMLMLNRG